MGLYSMYNPLVCVHTFVSMLFTSLTLVHCHLLFNLILVFVFYAGQVGSLDWNSSGKDAEIWREIELRERPTNELSSEGFLGRKASLYKAGQKLGRQMSRTVRDLPQFHKCWQKTETKGNLLLIEIAIARVFSYVRSPSPNYCKVIWWRLREIYTHSRFMS